MIGHYEPVHDDWVRDFWLYIAEFNDVEENDIELCEDCEVE